MTDQTSFQWLARGGYAARGVVYVLVAGLALFSVIGGGGQPDTESALQVVLQQPLGRVWLALIALGLVGFICWRMAQALANADDHPRSAKGYMARAGLLVSGLTYCGLAFYAASIALDFDGSRGSGGEETISAWVIEQPFGRYLLAAIGLAVVAAGAAQIIKGLGHGYRKYMNIPPTAGDAIECICSYGLAARGMVFVVIGVFFLYAAITIDPTQAGGISEALSWVRQLPFGAVLYAAAAFGMLAFGLYGFVEAAYRRIRPPSPSQLKATIPF